MVTNGTFEQLEFYLFPNQNNAYNKQYTGTDFWITEPIVQGRQSDARSSNIDNFEDKTRDYGDSNVLSDGC